jgi:hypothetical protein
VKVPVTTSEPTGSAVVVTVYVVTPAAVVPVTAPVPSVSVVPFGPGVVNVTVEPATGGVEFTSFTVNVNTTGLPDCVAVGFADKLYAEDGTWFTVTVVEGLAVPYPEVASAVKVATTVDGEPTGRLLGLIEIW